MTSKTNKEKLGILLRTMRMSREWTQAELSKLTGLSVSRISMYESGNREPDFDTLELLADTFNVPMSAFMPDREVKVNNLYTIQAMPSHKVPLIGSVACGQPILAQESYEAYVDSPSKADYALKVEGDSMEPQYLEGDIVYIRAQDDCDDGQVAVVLLDDSAALKHIYHVPDGLQLISNNPAYPPKTVTVPEYDTIRILGIPCGFTRMYK